MTIASPLPLIHFYHQLRSRGFELGLDEYQLLLDALATGMWMPEAEETEWKTALYRLCCTLWYKPNQSLKVFSELFEESWEKDLAERRRRKKQITSSREKRGETREVRQEKSEKRKEVREERSDKREEKSEEKLEKKEELIAESYGEGIEEIFVSYQSTKTRDGIPDEAYTTEKEQLSNKTFLFTGAYLPISKRDIKLTWRYLRSHYDVKPSQELDVPAIIQHIAETGQIEPIFQQQLCYHARLMVLIDKSETMAAFGTFSETMAALASKGDFGKFPSVYYFNEVPEKRLFTNPQQSKAIQIKELSDRFVHRKVDLLIISDAGAARGTYSEERVLQTRKAIHALHGFAEKIVWLNPMPKHRWRGSSAQYISDLLLPMFEASNTGLKRAVDVLRGKHQITHDT